MNVISENFYHVSMLTVKAVRDHRKKYRLLRQTDVELKPGFSHSLAV